MSSSPKIHETMCDMEVPVKKMFQYHKILLDSAPSLNFFTLFMCVAKI